MPLTVRALRVRRVVASGYIFSATARQPLVAVASAQEVVRCAVPTRQRETLRSAISRAEARPGMWETATAPCASRALCTHCENSASPAAHDAM